MTQATPSASASKAPLFADFKPTGNLYRPDIEKYLRYSRSIYQQTGYADGQLCRLMESRLAAFHQVERVVSVNSGFWGHVLAMSDLALPGRREVIAPALAYRRTDDMIAWAGLTPHFCDVEPNTLGVSAETVEAALTDETALILAPHPMVNGCDAQGIEALGRARGIPVVFDSVEAAYRQRGDKRIGGFGDAEVFSMHATKLLNAFEGGYVTTNNVALAERLARAKRGAGTPQHGLAVAKALDATLSEMHAAMALASLDEVDEQVSLNRRKYALYAGGLAEIDGLDLTPHRAQERPDYRLIVARIGPTWPLSREDTLRRLQAKNVLARPYYAPLHHKACSYTRIIPSLPVTEAIHRDFIVLPSGAHVSEDDVGQIVHLLAGLRRRSSAPR